MIYHKTTKYKGKMACGWVLSKLDFKLNLRLNNYKIANDLCELIEHREYEDYITHCMKALALKTEAPEYREMRDNRYGLNKNILTTNDIISELKNKGVRFE